MVEPLESRTRWRGLLLLVALLTLMRIAIAASLDDRGTFAKYTQLAERYIGGEDISSRLGDLSPAYFWSIVALRSVGFTPAGIVTLQILALSASAMACAAAARSLSGSLAMWIAVVLLFASRAAFLNALELEPETLIIAALSTAAALLIGAESKTRFVLGGVALGVAAAARPSSLLAAFVITGSLVLHKESRRHASLLIGGALVPLLLFAGINARITGSMSLMDPGSVFYEGMNPNATGLAGVQPQIVNDLETTTREPDALHLMYRRVAASSGVAEGRDSANRYWTSKAIAFASTYPLRAASLLISKARAITSPHDPWDLLTTVRKERELRVYPRIAFPFLLLIGASGMLMLARRNRTGSVVLFALSVAPVVTMLAFYVTARQRNPLMVPLCIAAACAIAEWVRLLREERERGRALFLAAVVLGASVILALPTRLAREDEHGWETLEQRLAAHDAAEAFVVRPELFTTIPPAAVVEAAKQALLRSDDVQTTFDIAVALIAVREDRRALGLLDSLYSDEFRRESRLPGSVSYHRARALLHLGRIEEARRAVRRAAFEQPGEANVLALTERLFGGTRSERADQRLDRLHDPLSANLARAIAAWDAGDPRAAAIAATALRRRAPEWRRPRNLLLALRPAMSP